MKHLIIQWNNERGLLENFDPTLELKMLSEEAKEFYTAEAFEHKLVEFADFIFVKEGTIAKNHCQILDSAASFVFNRGKFVEMMNWIMEIEDSMRAILWNMYSKIQDDLDVGYDMILDEAIDIVISNNQRKGNKKIDGKVVKSADQIKPEEKMKEYLDAHKC